MSDKLCFVIAPIGEVGSETRKRSDRMLKFVAPAVQQCGYEPVRADQICKPGLITSQVIQHVVDDPLVIADLTDRNPNVFYELAIRHAIRRPFIQLIPAGEQIPFDVAGTRTIRVDYQELESVDEGREEIVRQIKVMEADSSDLITPISASLDLQLLHQSENAKERSFADVLSALAEMRRDVESVAKRVVKQPPIPDALVLELETASHRLRMMIEELFAWEELDQFAHGGKVGTLFSQIRGTGFEVYSLVNRLAEMVRQ